MFRVNISNNIKKQIKNPNKQKNFTVLKGFYFLNALFDFNPFAL